ncbi:MAG: type 2 lanthipeptide synthetase LanM family protein [Cyanobacteria bacterium J06639_18]
MLRSLFESSSWYRAVRLHERIALLQSKQKIPTTTFDEQLAQRRKQRWLSKTPFKTEFDMNERLAVDDITAKEFQYILGESVEGLQERCLDSPSMNWLKELQQAYCDEILTGEQAVLPSEWNSGDELWGFLYLVEPLMRQGLNRLQKGIQILEHKYYKTPFNISTITEILFPNLSEQLFEILHRTSILELNVARVQGLLKGETPAERFWSFLKCLRQRKFVLDLFQEYPVLARQVTVCVEQWVNFNLEFLQHLCVDWQLLNATFSPKQNLGLLVQVESSRGDRHRGGRSVLIAEFSSGLRIVYKPRSLAVDVHFQELLQWVNNRNNNPFFRTITVLDRTTYGWSEFVFADSCKSLTEVRHFYEQQGGYLALLYALEATDFHYENLIAAGANPVLIDLETLFEPRCTENELQLPDSNTFSKHPAYSVLRTGLLPKRIWSNNESEGIDLSGLAARDDLITPHRSLTWEGVGTDTMKLIPKQLKIPAGQNRPNLNGTEVNAVNYIESIIAGFTKVYHFLWQQRDELVSEGGPIARFAEDKVRVVLRPTKTYSRILRNSFHPDMLRDALERDCLFDRLWLDAQHYPFLKQVIAAEQEDLWQGDVPIFTTRPNSCHLWTSTNKQIRDFFEQSAMAQVQRRLQQLSAEDLARQLWFIRASMTTLVTKAQQRHLLRKYDLREPQQLATYEQLLTVAGQIGDRLEMLTLQGEQDITWLGVTYNKKSHWSLEPVGINLYDGSLGIILFLSYLGDITREERYQTLARSAFSSVCRQLEAKKSLITSIGAFNGWGGIIYTFSQLGILWKEPKTISKAEEFLDLLPALIQKDEQLDIVGGSAGCISSLLCLYNCRKSPRTLEIAVECGEHLLDRIRSLQDKEWLSKLSKYRPLKGFSHGLAGMAWVFLVLADVSGKDHFRQVALEAIAFERSMFSPAANYWLDLRQFETTVGTERHGFNCGTTWCHGATGIGLARLNSLPYIDDVQIHQEIDATIEITLQQGFGFNHSLCHGDLGNLELLLQASQTIKNSQWTAQFNRFASIILASINKHGCLCGVPLEVEVPGMMTGLAGIGYQLLRLANPNRIPSILMLAPPPSVLDATKSAIVNV